MTDEQESAASQQEKPAAPQTTHVEADLTAADEKEDARQAASMAVGIASSVATAALAVLAVLGAIVTYVAANYADLTLFYVLAAITGIAMVAAVYIGIIGVAEITKNGYKGEWKPSTKSKLFNKQAFVALFGVVVLAATIVVGFTATTKPPDAAATRESRQVAAAIREEARLDRGLARTDLWLARIAARLAVPPRH